MGKPFLTPGNGHQHANRKKALAFVLANLEGATSADERTVDLPPYGVVTSPLTRIQTEL